MLKTLILFRSLQLCLCSIRSHQWQRQISNKLTYNFSQYFWPHFYNLSFGDFPLHVICFNRQHIHFWGISWSFNLVWRPEIEILYPYLLFAFPNFIWPEVVSYANLNEPLMNAPKSNNCQPQTRQHICSMQLALPVNVIHWSHWWYCNMLQNAQNWVLLVLHKRPCGCCFKYTSAIWEKVLSEHFDPLQKFHNTIEQWLL